MTTTIVLEQNTPILQLFQVTHQFGSFVALKNINLQISSGERVALVGSSGAGKSTLIRLLNGTLSPTKGEIGVLGQNLVNLSPRQLRRVQQQIGTIYQQLHLVDNLRVIHNVNAGHLGRWSFLKAAFSLVYPLEVETAAKALQRVGIANKLYTRTASLSGGQQQRVALARVLVQDPQVILADEPISSLDPQLSLEMMNLLRDLSIYRGKTVVMSLHSIDLAMSHCDRAIGLRNGNIIFDTPTSQVSDKMIADLYQVKRK